MTPEHLPTEQYDAQLAEKVVRLQSMMTPFNAPVPEVFRSPVSHYRMRAEFRIWHDGDDLYHIISISRRNPAFAWTASRQRASLSIS